MKHLLLPLFVLFAFAGSAQTNGLIAHWDFNGTVNDISGNGHNGTANNISYTTGKTGLTGTAAKFNGSNSFITIPYKTDLNVSKYTIAAVVKPEGYYTGLCQVNILFQRGTDYQPGAYRLAFFDNAFDNHNCNVTDTSKNVFFTDQTNTSQQNVNTSYRYSPTIVSNQWYCVVATYDGDTTKLYIDGVLKSTRIRTGGNIGSSTQGAAIGANRFGSFNTYPYWFNGLIDDMKLYDRVLSPSEITSYCGMFDSLVYLKQPFSRTTICYDDTLHVNYGTTDTFNTGNIFTAELSDATGSFANPQNIGSLNATTDGTIICTIPSGLTAGNNYKIRVVSTSPVRTSDISQALTFQPNLTPSVSITANPAGPVSQNTFITFVATAVDAGSSPTFQWYRNNQPVSGNNSNVWFVNTLNDGDTVNVVVYSSNTCPPDLFAKSNDIIVRITSSVDDMILENLSLYPNPNKGVFTLSATGIEHQSIDVEVINLLGQAIYNSTITPDNRQVSTDIHLNDAPAGIYILRITSDGKQRNIKFRVQ